MRMDKRKILLIVIFSFLFASCFVPKLKGSYLPVATLSIGGQTYAKDMIKIGNHLYVASAPNTGNLTRIDLTTFTVDGALTFNDSKLESRSMDYFGAYLYASNYGDVHVTKIDYAAMLEVDSLTFGNATSALITDKDTGLMYVGLFNSSYIPRPGQIALINLTTFTVTNLLTFPSIYDQTIQQFAIASGKLYALICDNYPNPDYTRLAKIDLETFTIDDVILLDDIPSIGEDPKRMVILNGYLYAAKGDTYGTLGMISKVDLSTFTEVQYMNVTSAYLTDIITDGVSLYVSAQEAPTQISVISPSTMTLADTLILDSGQDYAYRLVLDGHYIYSECDTEPILLVKGSLVGYLVNTISNIVGVEFFINGTQTTTPNATVLVEEVYNFTAVQYYENASGIWTFSNWLVNGTTTYTTLEIDLTITGNTTLYITYIPYSYTPPEYTYLPDQFLRGTTTIDYYMRHDTHTINGQLAYILNQTQSPTSQSVTTSITSDTIETATWGFRFYLTYNDNTTQELSAGTATAIMTRTTNGSGLQTSTWLSPYVDWGTGNVALTAIRVDVYVRFGTGTWQLASTYSTSLLSYRGLMNSTWTIYLYTEYSITEPSNYNLTATTRWGSTTYTSGINGITFVNALPYELMTNDLGHGDLITFLFRPYIMIIGPGFYGLILLLFLYPLYRKTNSFTLILALLMLLGGAGGYFLKAMIPAVGFEWGWVLFAFGLAGFMYKIIRSAGSG